MKAWTEEQLNAFYLLFILLAMAGVFWSLGCYLPQKDFYDESYGRSKMIPTPFKNDHIRFSLAIAFAIFLAIELYIHEKTKPVKILLGFSVLLFIAYLHILAAKSGLLAFYLMALLGIIHLIFRKQHRGKASLLLLTMLLIPVLMYISSSTLKNKMAYFKYSILQMQNKQKDTQISDEGRLISYQYALKSISKHPVSGVGLGDVYVEMEAYYRKDFPKRTSIALLPHNQFLVAGMAVGVVGIVYLLLMLIFLILKMKRSEFITSAFLLMIILSMLIEPLFETQYGTCLFLFFLLLLLQRHRTKLA